VSEKLFEVSGHLSSFKDGMFGAMDVEGGAYALKPMNCPGHICVYDSRPRSYRDLPIRYAEFGTVYRYGRSGVLHGMLRVRGFTQDDAHVFCTREQIYNEIERLLDLVHEMLVTFGYPYTIELATRPTEKALGEPAMWEWAQQLLADVLNARGQAYAVDEGGGAFYGPKLDFKLIDAIGRKWQGPTVQLDFNLPERFGLTYVGADNERHRPFMLHRVLVGSVERFIGILIEHYAGNFPLWLAPEQVRVIPITKEADDAARSLASRLRAAGLRVGFDERGAAEDYRTQIKDASLLKVNYMAIIGKREADAGTVTLRARGAEKQQSTLPVEDMIARLSAEAASRATEPAAG
jgi:threonyl-tRNA synthetase